MEEPIRWVSKSEAAAGLKVSLSTLDRMIRRGRVAVRREGRGMYVQMEGPEYLSDEEMQRRSIAREDQLQCTARELDQSLSEGRNIVSQWEREEAREDPFTADPPYHELERNYLQGVADHKEMEAVLIPTRVIMLVLPVSLVLLWWFVLR